MSHRLTFGSVKETCARVLNLSPTDPRVLYYVNAACERLLYEGRWVGTTLRYVVCADGGCLTWPREIETVEAAAICSRPITLRNGWYEMLESGPGIINESTSCFRLHVDRGDVCAFDDIRGTGKKIAVRCDGSESGEILLRYYDSNGQKVYTQEGDEWIEGEMVTFAAAGQYAYTANQVMPGGLYGVVKPVTNRVVRLYQYAVVGGALKPLAYYEPDEELPVYRRSLIPSLNCSTGDGDCTTSKVTIAGKMRFIAARNDNSYLAIGHQEAIRMACQSIFKSEANLPGEAAVYMYGGIDPVSRGRIDGAVPLLNKQLAHWMGDGVVRPIRMSGDTWAVQNVI